jgi:hypothetical protein
LIANRLKPEVFQLKKKCCETCLIPEKKDKKMGKEYNKSVTSTPRKMERRGLEVVSKVWEITVGNCMGERYLISSDGNSDILPHKNTKKL